MGSVLPDLAPAEFGSRLRACSPEPLDASATARLYAHYQELRRWNPRLSLVGPGDAATIVERHYGEALQALPLVPAGGVLLDVGSGAGFPGLVLAAVRTGLDATLVEARERKWAFLQAAAARASLPCRCLNARVGDPLPVGVPSVIDLVTVRALALPPRSWEAILARLSAAGRVLVWAGRELPPLPPRLRPVAQIPLAGSTHRRIVALEPEAA